MLIGNFVVRTGNCVLFSLSLRAGRKESFTVTRFHPQFALFGLLFKLFFVILTRHPSASLRNTSVSTEEVQSFTTT